MMEAVDQVVIVDKEEVEHSVDAKVLDMSDYLKGMKENGGIQNNRITLDTIKGVTLTKLIEFCRYCCVYFMHRYLSFG